MSLKNTYLKFCSNLPGDSELILPHVFPAGTDAFRTTLYCVILYVATHPEVQQKIQKEIDDVVGTGKVNHKYNYTHI